MLAVYSYHQEKYTNMCNVSDTVSVNVVNIFILVLSYYVMLLDFMTWTVYNIHIHTHIHIYAYHIHI